MVDILKFTPNFNFCYIRTIQITRAEVDFSWPTAKEELQANRYETLFQTL